MSTFAKITIGAFVGRKPEKRFTTESVPVTSFSVAVNKKGRGGKEFTNWYRVTAWDRLADFAATLLPGTPIIVTGELTCVEYQRNENTTALSLEVNATSIDYPPAIRREDATEASAPSAASNTHTTEEVADSDIKF